MRTFKLTAGKSDFNRFQIGKKIVEPCVCKYNLDWAQGCLSNINPYFKDIEEVKGVGAVFMDSYKQLGRLDKLLRKLKKQSRLKPDIKYTRDFSDKLINRISKNIQTAVLDYVSYDKEFIAKYFKSGLGLLDGKRNGCHYCYAHYKNNSQKVLVEEHDFSVVEKQLQEIPKGERIVRLGKTTEAMSLVHLDLVDEFLDLCLQYKVKCIIPTKMLYFEPTVADKLRRTRSVVGFSVFSDDLEPGPSNWGFDTQYRMECAKKYLNAGVQTVLKVTMDCTQSFKNLDKLDIPIYSIINFLKNTGMEAQLIPLRIHQKVVAQVATGHSKEELCSGAQNLFGNSVDSVRYEPLSAGTYIPSYIHQDFLELFKGHICGKVGHTFYCDSCSLKEDIWKININDTPPIPVKLRKDACGKQRSDPNQIKLF